MKDMSDGNAYNGGKSIPKQNKKAKAKDPKSQERKDAAVAKMNAEDKAARKAQADKFAAMKNEDLENNPDGNLASIGNSKPSGIFKTISTLLPEPVITSAFFSN